jgi:hypothetical protein
MQSIKGTTLCTVYIVYIQRIEQRFKGLVAVCHSFCIYFSFVQIDTFILVHHSFIPKHSLRLISISSQLWAQWAEPPEFYRWYNGS